MAKRNLVLVSDGILSGPLDLDARPQTRPDYRTVGASMGLVVEHRATGVVGAIVSFKPQRVVVRDRFGRDHSIRPYPGAFTIGAEPVTLVQAVAEAVGDSVALTRSGSVDCGAVPPRMARASRIWVEGLHDAELIEKIWGDDLRVEGIVVEQMEGMDDLAERVRGFAPGGGRRLGVLLDHYVAGSKEHRIASTVADPAVLITGHPYVDVWQAVKPQLIGLSSWPTVDVGRDWKTGVMSACGFSGPAGAFWRELLSHVETYRDLEQPMLNAVERLIDFVAEV